ncbi:MAG TPA: RHS repeat-associated core domain-containing protein [Burkholderiales bacterium]|nr:RHS repeat-associated core domain-containing protein [Burkholderiales bacterium]
MQHYALVYNADGTKTVTDPFNVSRTYSFQWSWGVARIAGITGSACPACGPAAQSYNSNGYLASRTDWNGNVATYLRQDSSGRLDLETSRTEASGSSVARTITTTWHATYRLPAQIAEPGRRTNFSYDGSGNLLSRTVTDTATNASRTWTYTYNSRGQVLTVDGPRTDVSDVTTYAYDATTGNLLSITNALGHVTQITSYDANGRPLTLVDPNGVTTTLTYSPRGWLTSRQVGSETTTYTYDYAGQLTKVTLPDGSYLSYTYDAAHRLTQIQDNLGNKVAYTLDAMGNRTQEQVTDPANNLARSRSRVYNSLNQLIKDIGGANPATEITQYAYDNQGNLTGITDPLNHVTANAYDALNRLKQVTDPGNGITQYALNALDQPTSVTDPRTNATGYTVDALGNLTSQTSPDTGATNNTYDAAGNLLTSQDAKGQTTTYTYDALNRVATATYQDGSQALYGYDAGANGKGRLTSITENAPGGALQTQTLYTYDARGRLLTDTRSVGAQNYLTQYGYDSAGRLSTLTYPSGTQLTYSYDGAGRVAQIDATAGGNAQNLVAGVAWQPFGGPKSWVFGNGESYSRSLDLDGRIAGFTLAGASESLTFDAASRITASSYFPIPAQSLSYGYDALDRLTSTVTPSTNYGFAYDANGNRTSKTVGAVTKTYAYPATNNKLSSVTSGGTVTYTHDANGSVTSDGVNSFTYDARGRLAGATTALGAVTYQVNALGQRYGKTVQGVSTVFVYDAAGRLIAETSNQGQTYTEYVWLQDTPVALITTGATPSFYFVHSDQLDTPRVVTDRNQQIRWRWDNDDPFGGNIANANPSGLGTFVFNLRYPGQYFDAETNQHYNYFRDYSPEIGRYVQSDPIGLTGGLNTYAYVYDSPLGFTDPRGLTRLVFDPSQGLLWVDPEQLGRQPYVIPAGSGKGSCTNNNECANQPNAGPIPPGKYIIDTTGIVGNVGLDPFFTNAKGDWGNWRVRISPRSGTNTFGRGGFYLHGGNFPGSAGCIDVGGGIFGNANTDQLLRDLLADPDKFVPVNVLQ